MSLCLCSSPRVCICECALFMEEIISDTTSCQHVESHQRFWSVFCVSFFRCASISWFQVVSKWVIDLFQLARLRVFQSYFFVVFCLCLYFWVCFVSLFVGNLSHNLSRFSRKNDPGRRFVKTDQSLLHWSRSCVSVLKLQVYLYLWACLAYKHKCVCARNNSGLKFVTTDRPALISVVCVWEAK